MKPAFCPFSSFCPCSFWHHSARIAQSEAWSHPSLLLLPHPCIQLPSAFNAIFVPCLLHVTWVTEVHVPTPDSHSNYSVSTSMSSSGTFPREHLAMTYLEPQNESTPFRQLRVWLLYLIPLTPPSGLLLLSYLCFPHLVLSLASAPWTLCSVCLHHPRSSPCNTDSLPSRHTFPCVFTISGCPSSRCSPMLQHLQLSTHRSIFCTCLSSSSGIGIYWGMAGEGLKDQPIQFLLLYDKARSSART